MAFLLFLFVAVVIPELYQYAHSRHLDIPVAFITILLFGIVVLAYILANQRVVQIASKGGEVIKMPTSKISNQQIFEFIESVEVAKAARIAQITRR